jgi:phosphoglycolate phosphatase
MSTITGPVLLFDIDGTLVRTGGAGKAAVERALVEHFGVTELLDKVPYSGRTDPAILADVLRVHDLPVTATNIREFAEAYLARLPACLATIRGDVCPGIPALLHLVRHRPLGLLTGNAKRGAQLKLEHFELWHHFRFGGFGDHHTDRDDVARSAIAAVIEQIGPIDPQHVWVIGDTPLDVSCARAIGARAVAVATGWTAIDELQATGADLVLESLDDLTRLPATWFEEAP